MLRESHRLGIEPATYKSQVQRWIYFFYYYTHISKTRFFCCLVNLKNVYIRTEPVELDE